MCVAQVAPLKAAFPSSSSTTGTVYPQCRWVSTKAPLKQVAHIQNGRLLPTQRRLLPIPAYLQRDIVGHAVGAESGSLLTLWCWVSPANSSSSRAHENKNTELIFLYLPRVYFVFLTSLGQIKGNPCAKWSSLSELRIISPSGDFPLVYSVRNILQYIFLHVPLH